MTYRQLEHFSGFYESLVKRVYLLCSMICSERKKKDVSCTQTCPGQFEKRYSGAEVLFGRQDHLNRLNQYLLKIPAGQHWLEQP